MRFITASAAASPALATLLPLHAMPWWACLTIALTGPAAYICRNILLYRLTRQAITKATPTQLPAIINAITGHHPTRRSRIKKN
jgi:hypothetical protein